MLGLGIIIVIIALLYLFGLLVDDKHEWEYRNPHDRTCKCCGQHEEEECYVEDGRLVGPSNWEVYRPGDPSKH